MDDQLLEPGDARAVPGDVRVHGQDEQPAFIVGDVELRLENLLDFVGIRHPAVGGAAEIREVVDDALDRQLDDACRLPVEEDLYASSLAIRLLS